MDKEYLTLVSMVCIVVLELYALSVGIDGLVLGSVIAVLSGLGGYEYAQKTKSE